MKWTTTLCLVSSAASCAALPLINSSFEAPPTPPDAYADVTPDDWVGIEPDDTFQITIRQGVRRSGLQSVAFNAGGTVPSASLSQAFSTTVGASELSTFVTPSTGQSPFLNIWMRWKCRDR